MREILFRGKRLDGGGWAYGDLLHDWQDKGDCIRQGAEYGECGIFPIDPSTVGQFTGLTDKNGTELYDWDILKSPYGICTIKQGNYTEEVQERIHETLTTIHPHGWFVEYTTGEQAGWDWEYSPDYFEKIGNIHDNPDLLKIKGDAV